MNDLDSIRESELPEEEAATGQPPRITFAGPEEYSTDSEEQGADASVEIDAVSEDNEPLDLGIVKAIDEAEEEQYLKSATEALIFSSAEPLTEAQHASALGDKAKGRLDQYVRQLNFDYERDGRAFEILHVAGGYQFFTRRDYSGALRKLFAERARTRISRAALETLAVVAFRGPVTRAEIDEIRGVDSGGVLRTLLDRRLVAVRGRANMLGRPLLYETTPQFLKHFGLAELGDLPRDSELLREWGQSRAIDEPVTEHAVVPSAPVEAISDAPLPEESVLTDESAPLEGAATHQSETEPAADEPESTLTHGHENGRVALPTAVETDPEKDIAL